MELREVHSRSTQPTPEVRRKPEMTTASALFTKKNNFECAFCRGNHPHEECRKVSDLEKRKRQVRKFGRCFRCIRKGHRVRECRATTKCSKCQGDHHLSLCEQKVGEKRTSSLYIESNSNLGDQMVSKANSQQNGTEAAPNQVVSTSLQVGSGGRVALQTAQGIVTATNGKQGVRCRILLDSGSQRTFVTSNLAKLMDGKPIRNEWLDLCAFGSKGKKTLSNVFEVNVAPLNGAERVRMEVYEVPNVARFSNVHPEAIKMEYEHLKEL